MSKEHVLTIWAAGAALIVAGGTAWAIRDTETILVLLAIAYAASVAFLVAIVAYVVFWEKAPVNWGLAGLCTLIAPLFLAGAACMFAWEEVRGALLPCAAPKKDPRPRSDTP